MMDAALELLDAGCSVLVAGDVILDRSLAGEVEAIAAEVPVLRNVRRSERPGGAANVAMNVAGLGCKAYLCGLWGADSDGEELAALLAEAGVDTAGVVTGRRPTAAKTRIMAGTREVVRLEVGGGIAEFAESQRLADGAAAQVAKVEVVVLGDHDAGALTREVCEAVIRAARTAGVPVVVQAKGSDLSRYSGATIVWTRLAELGAAVGETAGDADLMEKARAQLAEHEIGWLAVSLGERGMRMLGPAEEYLLAARAGEDGTGADDAFVAALAVGMAGGLEVRVAAELGSMAAGIVAGKGGTVPVSREELIGALRKA